MPKKHITIRMPDDLMKALPKPSLKGKRSAFIIQAIREKLEREGHGHD